MTAALIPSIPTNSEASQIIGVVNKAIAEINAALAAQGNGNVTGPNSAVAGHLATFADTTGKVIQDGGVPFTMPAPTVASSSTLVVTAAMAYGDILLDRAAGVAVTLPAATGTGHKYRFILQAALSGGSYVISTASGSDVLTGNVLFVDGESGALARANMDFASNVSGADTVTWNGSTAGGGFFGDWIEFTDIAANLWEVTGATFKNSASPVTMFSKV